MRLARDYYVRVDTNDYSVDPRVIGRLVDVVGRPGTGAGSRGEGVWSPITLGAGLDATVVTDPAHVEIAAVLRRAFQAPRAPTQRRRI